ncbi:MAG TPA: citrate synthase [Streptosporangiaceae bacterium]
MTEWISAAEAAGRLSIKPATLYAYVSRGVLERRREPGSRASMFDAEDIARLARKGRPRRAPAGTEVLIESALTQISGDRPWYRGRDMIGLARQESFERVAELLWSGDLNGGGTDGGRTDGGGTGGSGAGGSGSGVGGGAGRGGAGWRATPAALAAGSAARDALPDGTLPLERLQVIVPAMAATDPLRLHLDPPAVIAAGRALIAGMADSLAPAGPGDGEPRGRAGAGGAGSVAARLARALCPGPVPAGLVAAVQTAMVLVADHELAPSTFAVRVAASVRADPYAVVATGLGALGGALHGGATLGAELMLRAAAGPGDAPHVVGDLLRRGERIPGFGHFVYKSGDPRAVLLIEVVSRHAPRSPRLAVARAVLAEARRRALPEPNIDFGLAMLASVGGLSAGAGEAIFAVGRTAGWIAHALEEYDRNAPIRPRSVYTGPPAQAG